MITLGQVERLVRRIGEALGQPHSDAQTAKLAQDYADLCRGAHRRLEQCALMIEAHQNLHALQLAESAPPLLDLITLLSFRQAAEWRKYCQGHDLPWAEPFYDKHVRLLNTAYGQGVTGDHPFYRDYRRAVMKKDDPRALSILRVIARLNPTDQNTADELKRLEEKMVALQLSRISVLLDKGDTADAFALASQMEASGLPIAEGNAVWRRVQVARCQELLRQADALRKEEEWQKAEAVVDEIHNVATHYNLPLPQADAALWNELEDWTIAHRAAHARQQDQKRASSVLEYELSAGESLRASGQRLSLAQAQASLVSLDKNWRSAEGFEPLDPELRSRCETQIAWLRDRVRARQQWARVGTILIALVIIGAGAAVVPLALSWSQQRQIAVRLDGLESARRVTELQNYIKEIPANLKSKRVVADGLEKANRFLEAEAARLNAFAKDMAQLQTIAGRQFQEPLAQIGAARTHAGYSLDQLAPEYQTSAQNQLNAWDDKWRVVRARDLSARLDQAEQLAARLNTESGFETVQGLLPQIQSALAGSDQLLALQPPLEGPLSDRLLHLTNKAAIWRAHVEQWQKTSTALNQAMTLDSYLDLLAQRAQLPFASSGQRDAAGAINRLGITDTILRGELILPEAREAWPALTNTGFWPAAFIPEQPTDAERRICVNLREDKNLQDIYVYELITNSRPGNTLQTHFVFSHGPIALDRGGQEAGTIYDPTESRESLRFYPRAYSDWDYISVEKKFRIRECDAFERLGLGNIVDPNTGNFTRPVLDLFDQLDQDANSSAIFRAYITWQLNSLAQMRPLEWGFQWAPSVATHIEALKSLGAGELRSGDWILPALLNKERAFSNYFQSARTISFAKEAQFSRELARRACDLGFGFAGYVETDGTPITHETAPEYWGWEERTGTATLLFRRAAGSPTLQKLAAPAPGTPLFVFLGDRRQILYEVERATLYPVDAAGAIVPPLYSQL